jgi:hypothetical protein
MKKFIFSLIILAGILSITGCGVVKPIKGWKIYQNKDFSLLFPPDWKIDTTIWEQVSILPPENGEKKIIDEGVRILFGKKKLLSWRTDDSGRTVIDSSDNGIKYTLNDDVAAIEKMYRDTLKLTNGGISVCHLEESLRKSINGIEYQSITGSAEAPYRKWKTKSYIFDINNKYYYITFTASQTRYKELIKNADKILNSFRLK